MKNFIPILLLFLCSCTKSISTDQLNLEEKPSHFKNEVVPVITYAQRARVSMWMMTTDNNYGSSRADFLEIGISDTFSNAITAMDSIKTVDGSDNIAIKSPYLTPKLMVKEFLTYPLNDQKEIPLKTWNYSVDNYYFKFLCSNFPPQFAPFLKDKLSTQLIALRTDNTYFWYPITVGSAEEADSHRFSIVIKRM